MTSSKVRSTASGVTFQVGILSMIGNLYPTATSQSAGVRLTSVCPECLEDDELVKVNQVYVCTQEHGPFKQNELSKATGTAKSLTLLGTAEEVKEAQRVEGPGRVCNLVPYPATDVDNASFPVGSSWVLEPDVATPAASLLLSAINRNGHIETENGAVMLLGEIQLRETAPAKLVTITSRNGQIVVVEMARPELVNHIETKPSADVKSELKDQFSQIMATLTADFEANEHKSTVLDRFSDFIASKLGGEFLTLHEAEAPTPEMDLEAQLKQMLEGAR